jgi:hypothetical protein
MNTSAILPLSFTSSAFRFFSELLSLIIEWGEEQIQMRRVALLRINQLFGDGGEGNGTLKFHSLCIGNLTDYLLAYCLQNLAATVPGILNVTYDSVGRR